ncbi:precorrin-2 dehydrogenase/sirohydrochlorin ferrochelatase family protein [Selenomonas montiformis]|uniref:precorrin-2 dehydrogenase/sirohydrochlorin ferrochelatase family protein n=1 Tax=Selenomonas montiformis TaxID=2652285 RepID=UPI0039F50708
MLYPMNLDLSGRCCAVIGGGRVAERKITALLSAGAEVTVIAPALTDFLSKLAGDGGLKWVAEPFQAGMLAPLHPLLVFCTSDCGEVNRRAAEEAAALGALVNDASCPERTDFQVPSRVQRGRLLMTVSTDGASPALSRLLRRDLEKQYPESFGAFLDRLARIRQEVLAMPGGADAHQRFWRKVLNEQILELVRTGRIDQAEEEIRHGIIDAGIES